MPCSLRPQMLEHSSQLVAEARLVTRELVRVAILQAESWHAGLEEAGKYVPNTILQSLSCPSQFFLFFFSFSLSGSRFYTERDVEGMLNVLRPRHEQLMQSEDEWTQNEHQFIEKFGAMLKDSLEFCHRFQRTRRIQDITSAWDGYYHV